ncbi:MAG TPA: ATP-binding protein [Acidimicrobiia bacterium]
MRLLPASLKGRLALLFALGATLLVSATSSLVYARLDSELQRAINDGLSGRADDIGAEVRTGRVALPQEESFAQILSPAGTVIDNSTTRPVGPVLSRAELDRALRGEVRIDQAAASTPGLGRHARFLARPVPGPDGPVVIVVGASLDAVVRGRHALFLAFAVAGPTLIGLLAAGGWLLASAALRPVERMTEEADAISLAEPGRRLPQAGGDDEIAHLTRTLNAMLERIEASFARERAFLDDASHELRTPVSILKGELELALLHDADPAETRRALRSALEEAERLSRLAEDLLVLAREAVGRLPLHRQPSDLRELAAGAAARLGLAAGPVTGAGAPPVLAAVDPARFDQVLGNLLTNARRFARHQVRVEVDRAGGQAVVTVADDGPGFPPGLLTTAFDRFTRGDSARPRQDEGGAGLGLAIAAALVRAHGGTIAAENGPPLGGAVVRVSVPALDGE